MNDIQILISKYQNRLKELEAQVTEVKVKLGILAEFSQDLQQAGIPENPQSSAQQPTAVISERYSKMSMTHAIMDVLMNHAELTAKEIQSDLLSNGYESASKTLRGDIYRRLKGLSDDGRVTMIKEGKELARYKIGDTTKA